MRMFYRNPIISCIHPIYRRVFAILRKSRILARVLFGVKEFSPHPIFHWDWVTLCLRKALKKEQWDKCSFLDIGCGYAAILSIFSYKQGCRSITAVDILPEIVSSAEAFLRLNHVDAVVLQSDFGANLPNKVFDIIAFNATYIPEPWGKFQNIDEDPLNASIDTTVTWSGGEDGAQSIKRFLEQMPKFLTSGGKILLGFNRFYLKTSYVRRIVREQQLKIERTIALLFLTPVVFIIRS